MDREIIQYWQKKNWRVQCKGKPLKILSHALRKRKTKPNRINRRITECRITKNKQLSNVYTTYTLIFPFEKETNLNTLRK